MDKPTSTTTTTTQSYDASEPRRGQAGDEEQEDVDVNVSVDDIGKLRGGSISPSAYSTASSGSPLVRNHSDSSCQRSFTAPTTTTTRARPALRPTSIAAAQLECQQRQQRLEFSNFNNTSKLAAANTAGDNGARDDAAKMSKRQKAVAKEQALADAGGQQRDASKGFAYRLAKSMAFKAYRFNQFWSVNKLSYMNLVCLLMTLICLVTILTFSGGKGGISAINNGNVFAASQQQKRQQLANSRKALANNDDSSGSSQSESLDSLDSQALRQQPDDQFDEFSLISAGEQPQRRAGKFKRKSVEESLSSSASSLLQNRLSNGERESATNTPTGAQLAGETGDAVSSSSSSANNQELMTTTTTTMTTAPTTTTAPSSLVEPILNQLFNDMEFGSLIKAAIRRAGNATLNGKPVVRRTKNGATIIISSSSFNDSAPFPGVQQAALVNETSPLSLSSLLDKLIPPMLRPAFPLPAASVSASAMSPTTIIENGVGGLGGGITISGPALANGEPIFGGAAASSPFPRFGPLELASPFAPASGRFRPLFSMQPFAQPLPAGHFRSVPASPLGSLFSMMMRGGDGGIGGQGSPLSLIDELIESDDGPPMLVAQLGPQVSRSAQHQQQLATNSAAAPNATSVAKNDTLQAQATSQSSSSSFAGLNNATQANKQEQEEKSQQKQAAAQRPQHLRSLYSRPRGSMIIVSSSSSASPLLDPFQPMGSALPPFMALAPPSGQVMQLTMGGNEATAIGPLNPILRSILSNVMSDITSPSSSSSASSSPDSLSSRKTSGSQSKDRLLSAAASSAGEQDDDWPSSEFERSSWDEQPASGSFGSPRQLKALHRASMISSNGEDELDGSGDGQETSQQQQQQPPAHLASFLDRQLESGLLSGTIRQTIRGPGMSVERIIELPTGPTRMMKAIGSARQQQLASRADGSMMMMMGEGEGESERAPTFASRMDEPFPISSISRLFADMRPMRSMQLVQGAGYDEQPTKDQRDHHHHQQQQQQQQHQSHQAVIKNRSIMNEDDESESVDAQQASAEQQANRSPLWSPKIRVAGARLSMSRPAAAMLAAEQRLASSSAPETAILMPPPSAPMHFTIPASLDGNEAAEQQQHHHHHHDQQQQRQASNENRLASFEDTLNSMEDRLNHVLSVSSSPQQQQAGGESASGAQDNNSSKQPARADSGHSLAGGEQATVGEPQKLPAPMAYTSPSSPLFGFPVVQQQQQQSVSGNRQQRSNSFTYHSNHELANQAPITKQEADAPLQRSFMGPFLGPPAGLVMGRRLDDGPAAAISEQQQDDGPQQHQQAAAGAGGALQPEIEATDESYRTIVV